MEESQNCYGDRKKTVSSSSGIIFLLLCLSDLINLVIGHACNKSRNTGTKVDVLLYSQARKQSMLKEMLSREIDEPGPGPFSVLNCSQNLQRNTSVLTGS